MRTQEQIENSIEETEHEIKRVVEVNEFILTSKIESDIKREFSKRLNSELEWLYNIRDEEQEALRQKDIQEWHESEAIAGIL